MPKPLTLTRKQDFDAVHERGRAWVNGLMVLRILPNASQVNRFGFVVSRRLGKAVVRNRLRRRLREIVRTVQLRDGWDVVLIARSAAAGADFHALQCSVTSLLSAAGVLESPSSL